MFVFAVSALVVFLGVAPSISGLGIVQILVVLPTEKFGKICESHGGCFQLQNLA